MFSWMKAYGLIIILGINFFGCQNLVGRSVAQDANQQNNDVLVDVLDSSDEINKFEQKLKSGLFPDFLSDYKPFKYEVLFTDPVCGVYKYNAPVYSQSGVLLTQKPENVYCKNKFDLRRSGDRISSPQYRIIQWIEQLVNSSSSEKEIFFTYLSFRNKAVKEALCSAAKKGVRINFVMSATEDQTAAKELVACNPDNVQMKTRGMEGGLGFAHNKFFIINPNSKREFKIVFSSGNMTSGPVIHHENWNFITTHAKSHFAQSHICAMRAEWNDQSGRDRKAYIKAIRDCRASIAAPEEKDIKVFFIPGEGEPESGITKKTAVEYLLYGDGEFPGILNAKKIWMGCHRFFYSKMINALSKRMTSSAKPELRIVADDDTFYKVNDPNYTIGDTMPEEYYKLSQLSSKGAKIKYMETNGEEHQLHHSKYFLFAKYDKNPSKNTVDDFKSVFTGSANLTGAGFNKNWENSYYITIPSVVKAFAEHYVYTWDKLATAPEMLPKQGLISDKLSEQPIMSTVKE